MNQPNCTCFPELSRYDRNPQGQYQLSLDLDDYWTESNFDIRDYQQDAQISEAFEDHAFSGFEVTFHVGNESFYCYLKAKNVIEAMGWFVIMHPHICAEQIESIVEV